MQKVLFVCLGNICRSPLAEAVAKDYVAKHSLKIEVDSCGTGDWHIGETPCENSIKVAKNNGLDISKYSARQITQKDLIDYDFIIGLDRSNISNLKKIGCQKTLLLGDFGYNGEDVPDPYFFDGFEGFDKVFKMIDTCVKNFIDSTFKS